MPENLSTGTKMSMLYHVFMMVFFSGRTFVRESRKFDKYTVIKYGQEFKSSQELFTHICEHVPNSYYVSSCYNLAQIGLERSYASRNSLFFCSAYVT